MKYRPHLTVEQEQRLRESISLRFPTEGPSFIALEHGVPIYMVRQRATKMGIVAPLTKRRQDVKASLKMDYFKEWGPSVAYDLGYISADGGIEVEGSHRILSLKCAREDESIILGVRERLGSLHKITRYEEANDRGELLPYTRVKISSRDIVEDLVSLYGIVPNKSELGIPFPRVPEQFLHHYVRGYFDGDGSTAFNNRTGVTYFRLYGEAGYLLEVQVRMVSVLNLPVSPLSAAAQHGVCRRLGWEARADVKKIYLWLYPEGDYPFLPRKKRIMEEACA